MTENMPLRESVNLEDVMREVKALREEVRRYQEAIKPVSFTIAPRLDVRGMGVYEAKVGFGSIVE